MLLKAEKVIYDQLAGRMDVPVPGSLLYQDHRQPATRPAATQSSTTQSTTQPATTQTSHRKLASKPTTDQSGGSAEGRGKTAFQWQKSLVYERAQQRATMTGDVIVLHQPDDPAGMPFKLTGQTLTASLRAQRTRPPAPAAQTCNPLHINRSASKWVSSGRSTSPARVRVTSTKFDVDAEDLSFDPIHQVIIAHGDPEHPVTVFFHETGSYQTMTYLYWDMATDTVRMQGASGKFQR